MSYLFGDGFDLYATIGDTGSGYWDTGLTGSSAFVAGRFAGGQAVSILGGGTNYLTKISGVNDAVHHLSLAYRQTAALTGTTLGLFFQLIDNVTNQCCIVFRSDGVILLTSATPGGTTLATYSGAVTANNTWFQFEFEVIISNTVGRFRARKNGNSTDDYDSGATLNTRPGANSYANKMTIGQNTGLNAQQFDDLFWRSDATTLPWLGDIRCYTRMPASDVSAQFSKSLLSASYTPSAPFGSIPMTAGQAYYAPFTPIYDGTIATLSTVLAAGYTGNLKCSLFTSVGGAPAAVLGSATPLSNPIIGTNTFTFGTPVAVTKGVTYWVGMDSDFTQLTTWTRASIGGGIISATPYASFPVANPVNMGTVVNVNTFTYTLTLTSNNNMVNEAQQDGTTTYVYDTVVGHADLYNIAAPVSTPSTTVVVTTRGFIQKSDAGVRQMAMQLKSGATTVQASSGALSAATWAWVYRTDATDPDTGAAWTASAVNSAQIGPIITV